MSYLNFFVGMIQSFGKNVVINSRHAIVMMVDDFACLKIFYKN